MMPYCSVVMATFNHAPLLRRTLQSIFTQDVPFDYEVIVVNDGSTDETVEVLGEFLGCRVHHVPPKSEYVNPAKARNIGYRMAKGDVIICQSDDVMHTEYHAIEKLCAALNPGTFVIAGVRCDDAAGPHGWYSHSLYRPAPYLFLGAVWRKDLYAVGGNDQRFTAPGYDDDWFGDCLIHGRGLQKVHRDDILGYHQNHDRSAQGDCHPSRDLYRKLCETGVYQTQDAPWPLNP